MNRNRYRELQQHCQVYPQWREASFQLRDFGQCLHLTRLTPPALDILATVDDALANYLELACDLIFDDEIAADAYLDYFRQHLVTPWHRESMKARFFDNRFDPKKPMKRSGPGFQTRSILRGKRRIGCWITGYADTCRSTGEVACAHLETRHSGVKYLRRIGIEHPRDLVGFDFDRHFAQWPEIRGLTLDRRK